MNKSLTLFCCLLALLVCKEPYPSEKDVLLIDENNFGFALRELNIYLFYSIPQMTQIAKNLFLNMRK